MKRARKNWVLSRATLVRGDRNEEEPTVKSAFFPPWAQEVGADRNAGNPKTPSDREQARGRYPHRRARWSRTRTRAWRPATEHPSPATVPLCGRRERRSHRRGRNGSARGSRRRTSAKAEQSVDERMVWPTQFWSRYLALTQIQIQILRKNCHWQLGRR